MADRCLLGVYFLVTFMTLVPHVHLLVPQKTPFIPTLSGFEPAAIGSKRELVCNAYQTGAGTITYRWYKYSSNNGVENWESKGPISTSQKYIFDPVTQMRVFYTGGKSEYVRGKYKCRVSNSAGTRDSEWGDLYVYEQCPDEYTVSVSPTPTKQAVGSTFFITCYLTKPSGSTVTWTKKNDSLSGAETVLTANKLGCQQGIFPRYQWSKCGSTTSTQSRPFSLQVTNAQASDSGYWFCRDAGLKCGSKPIKTVVQVLPPSQPQITGFPSGPVLVGTKQEVKCSASHPGDTYDWYKDGVKLTTSLTYAFLVKKESAGVYKCVAKNGLGSATSSEKTLIVYYKPDSVVVSSERISSRVGQNDKFTCTATGGKPTPTLKIYFKRSGGTPVEVIQGQERVMAKEDNQAEYYCEATVPGYSTLTKRSGSKTYTVTFPNTKVFFTNKPTAAVQVGQVIKFGCQTDESNPISSIKWYKYIGSSWRDITSGISSSEKDGSYGGKIRSSDLSITATKEMNGATVRCKATYGLKGHEFTAQDDTKMNVKSAPVTKLTYAKRQGTTMTARWVPLDRSYTKIRIKYCRQDKLDLCGYHIVTDQTCPTCQTVGETHFVIEGSALVKSVLVLYMEVFDGTVVVFRSPSLTESRDDGTNIGLIVGITVTVVLVIVVVIVVVIVLRRRKKACFAGKDEGQKQGQSVQGQNNPTGNRDGREHMYVNLNPAFEAGESTSNMSKGENEAHHLHPGNKEAEYVNAASTVKVAGSTSQDDDEAHYLQPHKKEVEYVNLTPSPTVKEVTYDDTVPPTSGGNKVDHTNVQNLSIEEFKIWLLSKDVTKPTYNTLTKHGLHKPKFFVMLQQQHLERLRIRPMAQEILVQKLVENLQSSNQPTLGEATADVEEYGIYSEPYDIPDNLHAAKQPDVIAEPSYVNLTK